MGRTGEWSEVVAVGTERSEVRTKTTEGQYSPVRLELARLGPVHKYRDIFESATFSFRIQKFPRSHVSDVIIQQIVTLSKYEHA